jgi:uncharacterized protein YcgI (DUF1989 family)
MKTLLDQTAPRNTGWGADMKAGQILRLSARTIIDFVCFDARDRAEAFDQAPTKAASNCLYLREGDAMMSRGGMVLMTLLEDGFKGLGTHDMQFGMCGRARHKRAAQEGRLGEYLNANVQVPDHGCAENLTDACRQWNIPYEDIPSPVNLFQNMAIDQRTGRMQRTQIRPAALVPVTLRAERNLLVAFSACPDLASATGGLEVRAEILQP